MNLANNLKRIRKENNLSQEQLAEKLGVSRQSVSKWESNQAYPEMDKVLTICQMFNLNMDELMNQDVKKPNKSNQSKININKYIEDFFDYFTKVINMLSSMKFKEKIKCITEQCVVALAITLLFLIIGSLLSSLVFHLLFFIPNEIYHNVSNILADIYIVICLVLGTILFLHIFKIRYLDYYVIVDEDKVGELIENSVDSKDKEAYKKQIERRTEKIIIRDPKHSGYKFLSLMMKAFILFVKFVVVMTAIPFCITFIMLIMGLVLSFLFVKTGLLFVGVFLIIIASIVINLDMIIIMLNFIFSKKTNSKYLIISFISSLAIIGIGISLTMMGASEFNLIKNTDSKYYVEDKETIKMTDNLFIHDNYYDIEYVETTSDDIKITARHTKYQKFNVKSLDDGSITLYLEMKNPNENEFKFIRENIDIINKKKILNTDDIKITVETKKENIEKLEQNKKLQDIY